MRAVDPPKRLRIAGIERGQDRIRCRQLVPYLGKIEERAIGDYGHGNLTQAFDLADQFADLSGAALAAGFGALSADHLEHTSEAGVRALSEAGTVAVLLPATFCFLRGKRLPPIDLLREHGVPIAVATDCNPGFAPSASILLTLNLACTLFGLTPEEALAGITCNAARALGMEASHGTLEAGKEADFVLWDIEDPAELAYAMGANPCACVIKHGIAVHRLE